jgi:hypothetical protein
MPRHAQNGRRRRHIALGRSKGGYEALNWIYEWLSGVPP